MGGKFTPFPKINIIDYKNHKKFLKINLFILIYENSNYRWNDF